jgi:hypothetical protein
LPHLAKTSSNKARKQLKTKKISQNKTIKEKKNTSSVLKRANSENEVSSCSFNFRS